MAEITWPAAETLNRRSFVGGRGKPPARQSLASLRNCLEPPSHLSFLRQALRRQGWRTAAELRVELGFPEQKLRDRGRRGDGIQHTTIAIGQRTHSIF